MESHSLQPPEKPLEHQRLKRGSLSIVDVAASTMANIAPAMSFYFSFGLIAGASGVASPLVIIVAAIAIALLGNTLNEFTKATPSTGSFVTFVGKGFGPAAAITTALGLGAGYILAMTAVVVISGGWASIILLKYAHIHIAWQILTLVFTAGAGYLMLRGAKLSTRWAAIFFTLEIAILTLVSILLLVKHSSSINLQPFNPSNLTGGLKGVSLGFPIAIYLFIGWENSASLAEETVDPRKNVGKAILYGVVTMTVAYVFLSYATVVGYGGNVKALSSAPVPFIDAAKGIVGIVVFIAYLAGFTSIIGALISGSNSQARILFSAGREGLLPSWLGRVSTKHETPYAAFLLFLGLSLVIGYIFGWRTDPIVFFGEIATLGAILVSLGYLVTNLALPAYIYRHKRDILNPVKHVIFPVVGALGIVYPLYELVKPGQPSPFSYFPYIALAILVVSAIYAVVLNARDKGLGERVGSIVADVD